MSIIPSVKSLSLKGSGAATGFPEQHIPLWWSSETSVNTGSTNTLKYLSKLAVMSTTVTATTKLITINPDADPNTQYALAFWGYVTSGYSTDVSLYDMTSASTQVVSSKITTTVSSGSLLRSSKFTLIPGHIYGVGMQNNSVSATGTITDATLIVFS